MRPLPGGTSHESADQPPPRHRQGADHAFAAGALCRHRKNPCRRRQGALANLPPSISVWLATIAHIRHVHTDYEKLLAEGYDRNSARFFVIEQTNIVLTRWRATRLLDSDDDEE